MKGDRVPGGAKSKKFINYMRHRELIERKLDNALGSIKKLKFIVQRQEPIETYIQTLEHLQEQIEEAQSIIGREGLDAQEGFGLY